MSVVQQCRLLEVARATIYAHQKPKSVAELGVLHRRLIDEEYTRHPSCGSRKMAVFLKTV